MPQTAIGYSKSYMNLHQGAKGYCAKDGACIKYADYQQKLEEERRGRSCSLVGFGPQSGCGVLGLVKDGKRVKRSSEMLGDLVHLVPKLGCTT